MSVLHRIFLSRGIQDKYGVEFQAFCIFHGEHHNSFVKNSLLQITFLDGNIFSHFHGCLCRILSVSAYHGNGIITIFLPASAHCRGLPDQLFMTCGLLYLYFLPMADDRLHGVAGKLSVMQDICGKIGYFHRITVAFFQNAKAVSFSGKEQAFQFLPVIQSVSEMDILGNVSHYRIGALPDAEFQHGIGHHSKILSLINYYMVCFTDHLRFFDPLVNISKSSQIVHIEFCFRNIHLTAFLLLEGEEFTIQLKYGAFPYLSSVPSPVGL